MFQGNQQLGYCRGHGIIMDKQYRIVRSVQPGGGMASSDMHEFRLHNNGETAVLTIYQQKHYDMTPWNIKIGSAFIMESIFQEVNTTSGEVIFEWRSLDHVEPGASDTLPDTTDTSGSGLSAHHPWDYFHINSIDKNADGDYLVSSRHTSCIYKISGKDGHVIWRLNGYRPSFRNTNFGFSKQHDARWVSENKTHTVVSFYNNGFNGYNRTQEHSSGMIVVIDHEAKEATMIHEYNAPDNGMSSSSQGSTQVLPNKNVFQGWGNNCFISEHDEDGKLLLWGYIALSNTMNYRALKYNWDAEPADVPAVWAYSKHASNQEDTAFYVSWNGATRVKTWRFWGSNEHNGTFVEIANTTKNGFETTFMHKGFHAWIKAEAIDVNGTGIKNSTSTLTFVPGPELRPFCQDHSCQLGDVAQFGIPAGMATPDDPIPPPDPVPEPEPEPEPVPEPVKGEPVQGSWDGDKTAADPSSDTAVTDDTNLSDTELEESKGDGSKAESNDNQHESNNGPTPTWLWIVRALLIGGSIWGFILAFKFGSGYVSRRYGIDLSLSRLNPFDRSNDRYMREGEWGDDEDVGMGLMREEADLGNGHSDNDNGGGLGIGKNSYVSRLRGGGANAPGGGKRVFSFERWLHRRNPSNAAEQEYAPVGLNGGNGVQMHET